MPVSKLDLSKEFVGRRALVTGGSRGIGAATAQRLLDGGAKVVVVARSRHEQTPTDATFVSGDVTTNDGAKKLGEEAVKILGGLDILVNNAASARAFLQGIETIPDEDWIETVNSCYLSAVRVTNAVLSALKQSSVGAIVNVSSGGYAAFPTPLPHYVSAKAALNKYSHFLSKELAPHKIRVNIVTPGMVVTPGADALREQFLTAAGLPPEAAKGMVPLGRLGQPQEIAEAIAFLVSDRGEWVTGTNLFVDGGIMTTA